MLRLRVLLPLLLAVLLTTGKALAHEGMWIPMLLKSLNEDHLKANGLKLSAEDIYSINRSSLKDAVVHFGGGCTGEVISSEGLLLTNHHCGYSQIQSHSSLENDYLSKGFWAQSKEEELSNPGLTATFIVRMADVTWKVLDGVTNEMSEEDRSSTINDNIKKIKEQETEDTHYEAIVRPFYHGNEYYLFITETFKDVRLVGAPPSSIGKFGFDTDNWVWPRHTGDFSIFRIYTDPDGKPAEYSKDNVPLVPKHHLPISLKGVEEGDFTMVYGFPGRTDEYAPSYSVEYILNESNPARIHMRKTSLGIIDAAMRSSDKVRIQYAAKQSRISNAYKKWIGQSRGLKRLKAIEKKQAQEALFQEKANAKPKHKEAYGSLLPQFKEQYDKLKPYAQAREYLIETYYMGPEILRYASGFSKLIQLATADPFDQAALDKEIGRRKTTTEGYFKNYDLPTDQKVFAALMNIYRANVQADLQPAIFAGLVNSKYNNDFAQYGEFVYSKSVFSSKEKVMEMLDGFNAKSAKKLLKDPGYILGSEMINTYVQKVRPKYGEINDEIDRLKRHYMEGLMTLLPKPNYYPDANSTLRLSYGKVDGYEPADGVKYRYYTTLDGVAEKFEPGSYEYDVPKKLLDLHAAKDYGQYGKDGELRVCFVASNHTSGGNSGSPVLDADGNLIGLNFDRSWESTMSDIIYDPTICRNIAVDIRYVLFIVDKFAGAGHLIAELDLVRDVPPPAKTPEPGVNTEAKKAKMGAKGE